MMMNASIQCLIDKSLWLGSRDHISLQDLECFLPPDKAANALSVLDIDGDGKISMADMRDAVVSIYHERTNLASTLKVPRSFLPMSPVQAFGLTCSAILQSVRLRDASHVMLFPCHAADVHAVLARRRTPKELWGSWR